MASKHYQCFIKEAFIDPIRSVLIVDDDYPTFDEILDAPINSDGHLEVAPGKHWHKCQGRIKSVIETFRAPGRSLLVDIHDGRNLAAGEEVRVAAHLHQTDLLVLDYELDKSNQGDGTRAIEIVRSVMKNDHFNLVIVHTREALDVVFKEILVGLMMPLQDFLSKAEINQARELIEGIEDNSEGFNDRVLATITTEQYFHSRLHPETSPRTMRKGQQPYLAFKELCDFAGWRGDNENLVLKYALDKKEKVLRPKMNVNSEKELKWSIGATKWIRSDSVFIAFSNKTDKGDLLEELRKALNAWNPQPSRLFLARMRAEMDEFGVVAQGHVLDNKHALAHWYHRLLVADAPQQRWYVAESVSRHSDQLLSTILPRVENFASRLVEAERENGEALVICKDHFKVNLELSDKKLMAEQEHNAFVCSKNPEGWHLTLGHVFVMEESYWVCLSPACDMVPSQISRANPTEFGERLPFIAVKLDAMKDGRKIECVQTNRYLFLRIDGVVKSFRFAIKNDSAPLWRIFYAEKKGEFARGTFDFNVLQTESGSRNLVFKKYTVKVISQLRYEYALNLMQKLGVSMTRIGLDFV